MKPISTYTRARRLLTLLLVVLCFTPAIYAEEKAEKDEERWYRVELLVFEQAHPQRNAESWTNDEVFEYPSNWVRVKTAEELALEEEEAKRLRESLFQQIKLEEESSVSGFSADDAEAELPTDSQQHAKSGLNVGTEGALVDVPEASPDIRYTVMTAEGEIEQAVPGPAPENEKVPEEVEPEKGFIALEEKTLSTEVYRLRRNGYQILYHESWNQPFPDGEEAPAILINGGHVFDDYSQLSGYVEIRLARYLHIHTHLWLSEFLPNTDFETPAEVESPRLSLAPDVLLKKAVANETVGQPDETSLFMQPVFSLAADQGAFQTDNMHDTEATPQALYKLSNVVAMKQRRRMRSNELHYIDHPLMGLLIRFTPYIPRHLQNPDEDASESEIEDLL